MKTCTKKKKEEAQRGECSFISYDGKYWLVEKYEAKLNGGGFFAIPIYFDKGKAEVRHAGGNWCYRCNGAFPQNPDKQVMIEAYQSQIEHLEWCKKMQKEYKSELQKVNNLIEHYQQLLDEIHRGPEENNASDSLIEKNKNL